MSSHSPVSTRISIRVLVLAAVALTILAACGSETPEPSPTPEPTSTPIATPSPSPVPLPVNLPRDDAPHDWPNTEWWYYNGSLSTPGGDRYGFHYVIFKLDIPFFPLTNVAHLSIVDHQGSTVLEAQRIRQAEDTSTDISGFSFDIDGWGMAGENGVDRLSAGVEYLAFDITLRSQKEPVLHGGTGFLDLGPLGGNYYYSRTRMEVSGMVEVRGEVTPVTGTAWFDHQWCDFRLVAVGWDWFSVRLDDESELMLYTLRDEEHISVQSYGTYAPPEGEPIALDGSDFQIEATGAWTSPASGADYPMGWVIALPDLDIDVSLAPIVEDAEFDATSSTGNYYWEGEVRVEGSHTGWGYVELVGYAPPALP